MSERALEAGETDLRRGVPPLLGYAALTASMDVYVGNRLKLVSPASIAAFSFTLAMVFFMAVEWRRRGVRWPGSLWGYRRDLVAINITTTLTWLATFYALDYLEPAIVNVIGLALGPVIMVLAGPLMRRHSSVMAAEVAISVAICVVLGVLVWVSFSGRSGLGDLAPRDAVLGLAFTVGCAAGSVLNILYMKRLNDAGCGPGSVLAARFFLMSVMAWVLVALQDTSEVSAAFLPGVVVAVIGVGLPIYVLQVGIGYTEPITTSLLVSLSPLFAFAMELADRRLRFSLFTLVGIACVVALVAVGAVVRGRKAPTPAADDHAGDPDGRVTQNACATERQRVRRPTVVTCAIIDAYGAGRLLPAALRLRGVDCVHVRSPFPDRRLVYRPEDFAVDLQHAGNVERTARSLRELGVNALVAAAESGVLLTDELSAALGVAGNDRRHSVARRDKFVMQETVRAAGLATAGCVRSASVEEVVAWVVERGRWPVVMKPVLSAGADNVIICRTVEEVSAAHARIMASEDRYGRRNEVVLAQEFLSGAEHYVNTVSRDGVHRVVEVWRYHKRIVDGRSVYDYEDLLAPTDSGAQEVVRYVRSVLDALGIRNGAGHTEVMLTPKGPFLIECGARLGGGQMPELLTRCVGGDQVDSLAFSIADPESFIAEAEAPYELKSHLRCVNLISPFDGTVPSEDGWEQITRLSSYAGMVVNLPAGSPLSRTVDMATCPGTVYLNSDVLATLESDCRTLRELELNGLYG